MSRAERPRRSLSQAEAAAEADGTQRRNQLRFGGRFCTSTAAAAAATVRARIGPGLATTSDPRSRSLGASARGSDK